MTKTTTRSDGCSARMPPLPLAAGVLCAVLMVGRAVGAPLPASSSAQPLEPIRDWERSADHFLANLKRSKSTNDFVTIVATDENHEAGLWNWLAEVNRVAPGAMDSTLFVSIDAAIHEKLIMRGAASILVTPGASGMHKRDFVWLARMQLFDRVLAAGFDVLMSDIDAHWLKSPLARIGTELANDADIVSSRSGDWPVEQADKWGAVLCMGFVYVRANQRTKALLHAVLDHMEGMKRPDDQVAMNMVLDQMGLQINTQLDDVDAAYGETASGLLVCLLSNYDVFRGFSREAEQLSLAQAQRTPQLLVYHGQDYWQQEGWQTQKLWVPRQNFDAFDEWQLREAGLWLLREGWREALPRDSASLRSWIETVATPTNQTATGSRLSVFLHIPKAAGTTFGAALEPVYPTCTKKRRCASGPMPEPVRHFLHQQSEAPVGCNLWGCRGHMDMSMIEAELTAQHLSLNDVFLMTMLRSPVDRVISEHKYALRQDPKNENTLQFLLDDEGHHNLLFSLLDLNMSLEEFIAWGPRANSDYGSINNRQTELLSGREHRYEQNIFKLRYAVRNLQLFKFIGLTEHFDASMRLLAHTLQQEGVPATPSVLKQLAEAGASHLNAAPSAASSSTEDEDRLRQLVASKNTLDQRLYDIAEAMFFERLCKELGECDLLNAARDKQATAPHSVKNLGHQHRHNKASQVPSQSTYDAGYGDDDYGLEHDVKKIGEDIVRVLSCMTGPLGDAVNAGMEAGRALGDAAQDNAMGTCENILDAMESDATAGCSLSTLCVDTASAGPEAPAICEAVLAGFCIVTGKPPNPCEIVLNDVHAGKDLCTKVVGMLFPSMEANGR